ncbi:hypothetical protein FPQ18DRAFT_336213 [Pyronema domesticum]|nr:hypothetical protein FPQ18DRAFT_336213 [Pyronema domesticum]
MCFQPKLVKMVIISFAIALPSPSNFPSASASRKRAAINDTNNLLITTPLISMAIHLNPIPRLCSSSCHAFRRSGSRGHTSDA